ncbi:MAG: DnaD domain protein [Clostridia bacterium]|nr:DnaD domain protein [Clostridia bacterium]
MELKPVYGDRAVAIPAAAVGLDDPEALRLLILLCADPAICKDPTPSALSANLGCDRDTAMLALEKLISAGLVREGTQLKVLDGEEIAGAYESDAELSGLVEECQNICGVLSFNKADVSRIVAMRRELEMDPEAILLLFSHLAEKLRETREERVTPAYVTKVAYAVRIRTVSAMTEYIENEKKKRLTETKLRTLFGLGKGKISPKYQKLFDTWTGEWGMGFDMIETAYDMADPEKVSPAYVGGILRGWFEKGIKTPEEAEAARENRLSGDALSGSPKKRGSRGEKPAIIESFDPEKTFDDAIRRSYEEMLREIGEKD